MSLETKDIVLTIGDAVNDVFPSTKQLITLTLNNINECIQTIHSGNQYLIYVDQFKNGHWMKCKNKHEKYSVFSSNIAPFITQQNINYFASKGIHIERIYINLTRTTTFWVTNDSKLYASGLNVCGQLGVWANRDTAKQPLLIEDLSDMNVIDIQFGNTYSIALCTTDKKGVVMVLEYWCRSQKMTQISNDIIKLIAIYYACTDVYGTLYSLYGGNGHSINDQTINSQGWKKVNAFNNVNIVKISAGKSHSMFLDSEGVLWVCGQDFFGFCGIGDRFSIYLPIKLRYFVKNSIKIIDVKCGWTHTLVVSDNGEVYSWGSNGYDQCGLNVAITKIRTPQLIPFFEDDIICKIDCGNTHSYCKTSDDKHYLFGSNKYNECIGEGEKTVTVPFCINEAIKEKTNGKIIKAVSLGNQRTTLIVGVSHD